MSIVVSPAGKIHRCTITSYVGVAKLATQICNYAQSLRFSPARNIDGDAVHAGLMLKMTYSHRQGADTQAVEEMREPTEIELKVSSIDLLEDDQREFSIDALYDETGFVEACRGEPEIPSFLADAACDIVEEDEAKPLPIEGGNVQYVRRFKVRVAGQG